MKNFIFFDDNTRQKFCKPRQGETKFGESLSLISNFDDLGNHQANYVIFGIPEDIGIRGNFGKAGASTTWDSFLRAFLNIQVNRFNAPENCMVLGEVDCGKFMKEAEKIMLNEKKPQEKLGKIVSKLDDIVSKIVEKIVAAGKTPIIIGGGHNNAYGNIKGTSKAMGKPINILNIDAHTDLRKTDYRHSGNGFSFVKKDGLMNRYAMFGIHKNYTPDYIFQELDTDKDFTYVLFNDLLYETPLNKLTQLKRTTDFLFNHFGMEIDCDAIQNFSSSAETPSGFSVNDIRDFIKLAKRENVLYLHICEAAAKDNPQIGKALSYFVSDFMSVDD